MRGVLLDLDGVVYVGDAPVLGATEAVEWLACEGIPFLFLTNTSSRPRSAIVAKLASMGIPASDDDILTPAVAARSWCGSTRPAGRRSSSRRPPRRSSWT